MDYGFKFEIGSFVKSASAPVLRDKNTLYQEVRGQIVEQRLQKCPGGVQRHYLVRWTREDGNPSTELGLYNEIELVPSEPFGAKDSDAD